MGAPNSGCMFAGLLEMSSLEQTQTKPPNSLGIFVCLFPRAAARPDSLCFYHTPFLLLLLAALCCEM